MWDLEGFGGLPILDIVDAHAGGDVGRVIVGGVVRLPGESVAERARFLEGTADGLRRMLIGKPHGDPTVSVNLVVAPSAPGAEFGLIIMGTMGYPGFSGSNAMCAVAALAAVGRLTLPGGSRELLLETPAGVSALRVSGQGTTVESVSYDALPGFVAADDCSVEVGEWGTVCYSLVYGGTCYALVDADAIGMDLTRTPIAELRRFLDAFHTVAAPVSRMTHPVLGAMPPLRLSMLAGSVHSADAGRWVVRVAVYMEPSVICYGPTGTGTTALLAWLRHRQKIAVGTTVRAISPYGTEFTGTLTADTTVGSTRAVETRIGGTPRLLGRSRVVVDFEDPLIDDHGLRHILDGNHKATPGDQGPR
ncbi:proline racemase family protein [Nocardia sp. NBC_00508]|uniref:proline racemase family protein n=1 Tax=Nocardia sp. NBC_00508 TaxID=2975992 RepID=UPI002E7FCE61|nr:proline racemase family protein [Nocardia sp. NBC_00508]WUD65415.1 proline racemase family protein [Nocardia sp. NBC_00508]